jgi:hypothetical protein
MQIILIEEVHEFPMIDMTLKPFEVIASNWSKLVSASLSLDHFVVTNDGGIMFIFYTAIGQCIFLSLHQLLQYQKLTLGTSN